MKLTEYESYKLLKKYDIDTPKHFLAKDVLSACRFAKKIKYPVVMKVMSPDILHKTDANCVSANIRDMHTLETEYAKILSNANDYWLSQGNENKPIIDGILVEETVGGIEVIVGGKTDSQFGKVIMFGLGGVFVEVLEDVSFRLVPLAKKDVEYMISEIKSKKILDNFRNIKTNKQKLIKLILNASKMFEAENITEFDLNPVFVNEKRAIACDARMIAEN
ncbi:MAG: acetate--CoA ligase family protein [Candidatus Aenigmarchaeota archaeon]|nr:acetate--CoA ligase family protein [Candidatus Aenigmarchaeota archaeon]MCK5176679.1 acetate--CoA ligase family protein [Candidatus Aenigmarchaeota archaeon]